jgi:hypothetical protein
MGIHAKGNAHLYGWEEKRQTTKMQMTTPAELRPHIPSQWTKWIPYACLVLFFSFIHLLLKPNLRDDLYFSQILDHTGLMPWLQSRYFTWSSRLLLEATLVLVLRLSIIIWITLDIGMILMLFSSLQQLLAPNKQLREGMTLALLVCMYPFFHMGSAGWVTTTVIYLWPLSLAAYALGGMARWLRGERIPWYRWLLYGASAVYGCNNELIAMMVLAVGVAVLLRAVHDKKNLVVPLLGIVLSVVSLAFVLTAPGNSIRIASETLSWMPDFPAISLFSKIRIGIVSTMEHFVSIPNAVLFLFLLLIVIHVFRENNSFKKRAVSALPLLIQVAYGAYFAVEKLFFTKNINYSIPEIMPASISGMILQGLLMASFAVMILCIAFSLSWILRDKYKLIPYLLVLGAGLATRLSLSFSPTVLASGTRTYMLIYFVLLAMIFLLWKRGLPKIMEYLFLGSALLGVACNVVTVYLIQSKYI